MLELNIEQKEYTTTTLLNNEHTKFELKTVSEFYHELKICIWKKLSRNWHRAEFMVTIQESDRPVKVYSQKDKRHPTQNRVPHFVMQSFPEWSFPKAASGRDAPGGSGSPCQADSQKGTAINYFIALLFRCLRWPAPWWADHRCWWSRWHRSAYHI